tara:strand:+ start:134 stop:322 length:189 start_codon:yes stop_codon:yes gene_type:complete
MSTLEKLVRVLITIIIAVPFAAYMMGALPELLPESITKYFRVLFIIPIVLLVGYIMPADKDT